MSDNSNNVDGGFDRFEDERTRIKNVYDKAKNEYKAPAEPIRNFGELNSDTDGVSKTKNRQKHKNDGNDFESFNMSLTMNNDPSKSKSTSRL